MIKKFIKDMNQSKGKPFSITLNIQTAPKNYIFSEWMSFSNWKLEYGIQVLPYSLWKLECLCLNILSNTTELEKRSKLMRPVWTWGFVAPTFMSLGARLFLCEFPHHFSNVYHQISWLSQFIHMFFWLNCFIIFFLEYRFIYFT